MKSGCGFIIAVLVCAALITGCIGKSGGKKGNAETEKTVYAMDTVMTLRAYGENAGKALDEAEAEIMSLDKALRRGSEDSEIYGLNQSRSAELSDESAGLIERALDICASTEGAFDISIAPVMDLWGFYGGGYNVPDDAVLKETLNEVNYKNVSVIGNTVTLSDGAQIDLGGIAKGYLSSRIIEIMSENGVKSGIVSLGGNVQTLGKKTDNESWRVAIQNPDDDGYIGILNISDMAVITSGGYQRFFERDGRVYHHIIDPATGYPANNGLVSVSVISADGTLADGLSTALFVMGLEKSTEYWRVNDGFDVVFLTDNNELFITEGIEDLFESDSEYTVIKKRLS